jgi:hypothetical protein
VPAGLIEQDDGVGVGSDRLGDLIPSLRDDDSREFPTRLKM